LEFFDPSALIFAYDLEDINPSFACMLAPGAPAVLDSFTEEQLKPGHLRYDDSLAWSAQTQSRSLRL
jgi:hypothetical protein